MRRSSSALTALVLGSALSALTFTAQPTPADDAQATPASVYPMAAARGPRQLLRNGWDFLKFQEYERALSFFREAEPRKKELNDEERQSLAQGIEQARRGLREEANGSTPSYARSGVRPRPGALAVAREGAPLEEPAREPIQLASGGTAAATERSDAVAQPSLPPIPTGFPEMLPPGRAGALPALPGPEEPPANGALPLTAPSSAPAAIPDPPGVNSAPPAAPPQLALATPGEAQQPALTLPEAPKAAPAPPAAPTRPAPITLTLNDASPTPATAPAPPPASASTDPDAVPLPPLPLADEPVSPAAASEPATAPPTAADRAMPAQPAEPAPATPSTPPALSEMPVPAPLEAPPAEIQPTPAPSEPAPAPIVERVPMPPDDTSLSTSPPAPAAVEPTAEPAPAPAAETLPVPAQPSPNPEPMPRSATSSDSGLSGFPRSDDSLIPERDPLGPSTLSPENSMEADRIAQRQEDELRRNLAQPGRDAAGANPVSPAPSTRLEISRAPSPTEARPIRAIPVPDEFVPLPPRDWSPNRKYWAAASTCHLPLYFQDASLERYGHSIEQFFGPTGRCLTYPLDDPRQSTQRFQIFQPVFSIGLFASQIALLPYNLVVDPPWEAEYDLGYYRPGDQVPCDMYYLPCTGVGPPLRGSHY